MPKRQTKFSVSWLGATGHNGQILSEWCQKGKDDYHAYCRFCDVDIKCDNAGKAQLLQHSMKRKHIETTKHSRDKRQTKLFPTVSTGTTSSTASTSRSVGLVSYVDTSLEAQRYWLAKMACNNYSLRSSDHIGSLFRTMFPDSKIAADFSLSQTSTSYIIAEGMLPHFTKVIIDDLLESGLPFSMHFDETSTAQVKKQMDLMLRYWSSRHEEVWSIFYTSLFFGHAESDCVSAKMYDKMLSDGIPVDKMATLVQDGPNVNKAIFQKMNSLILQDHPEFPGLVDLGSCVIHVHLVPRNSNSLISYYCLF